MAPTTSSVAVLKAVSVAAAPAAPVVQLAPQPKPRKGIFVLIA